MPITRPPYSPEFRRQMVDLVRAGRSPEVLHSVAIPPAKQVEPWATPPVSLSRRRSRSAPGLPLLTRKRADGRMPSPAWLPPNGTSWRGCGVRTSSSGWSAISSQKPQPGLHGRPARCRRALPVHEREPALLPGCHNGARARRVQGGLLRLNSAAAFGTCCGRRGVAETGTDGACHITPDVWGAPCPCRTARARREAQPQTNCAADAAGWPGGCQSSPWWPSDNPA
jgi:hypothetical protein